MHFIPNFFYLNISASKAFQFHSLMRFCANVLLGIAFVKMGFGQALMGKYEWLMAVASMATSFWVSGWLGVLPAQFSGLQTTLRRTYMLQIAGFLCVLAAIVAIVFGAMYGFAMGIFVFFSVVSYLIEYCFLVKERGKLLVVYSLSSVFILFLCGVMPFFLHKTPTLAAMLQGVAAAAVCRFFLGAVLLLFSFLNPKTWRTTSWLRTQASPTPQIYWKKHFWVALPLATSLVLGNVLDFYNLSLIKYQLGDADLAIFRYGAREMPLISLIANAFSVAYSANFAQKSLHEACQTLKLRSQKLILKLIPVSFVLLLTSHYIFPLVFNQSYERAASVFNVFLLLGISRLVFPQTILTGLQKNHILLRAAVLELTVNGILAVILLYYYGILGVAWATLAAFFVEKTYLICQIHRIYKLPPQAYIATKPLLIWALLLFAAYFVAELRLY